MKLMTFLAKWLFFDNFSLGGGNGHPQDGRSFDLTLTWDKRAPDGFERDVILVNGQFPGPLLDMIQGQEVTVTVHNKLPFNTTVHFHGIEMHLTPWSDGVPGVSQRPIRPGETFVYRWTATQYGSYWYHAHDKGQIEDGFYGPISIRPAASVPKPFHLLSEDVDEIRAMEEAERDPIPLVLSDWRHTTSSTTWDVTLQAGFEMTCLDSVLVNGRGSVRCRSPEEIASLLNPDQKMLLDMFNATMTDKACLPAAVLENIGGGAGNASAVLPGMFDGCAASAGSLETIRVTQDPGRPERWVALDVIGAFGFITAMFSIDEHPMWVYAVDGEYVAPQRVEALPVTIGDRYSVLVKLSRAGDFQLRVASVAATQILSGVAVLSYQPVAAANDDDCRSESEHRQHRPRRTSPPKPALPPPPPPPPLPASTPYINDGGANTTASVVFFAPDLARPYPPFPVAPRADQTFKLNMRILGATYRWALNSSLLLPADFESQTPILFRPVRPTAEDDGGNVTISTANGTWIDLIFIAGVAPMPPHPMHKHGSKVWVLGSGTGAFGWASVEEAAREAPESFNLVGPPRRDGFATPNALAEPAWLAVRYHVTNPGAWLLHCHIQNHMMGGMSMFIRDGVDAWPHVPDEYLDF